MDLNPRRHLNIPIRRRTSPSSDLPLWRWLTPHGVDILVITLGTLGGMVLMWYTL